MRAVAIPTGNICRSWPWIVTLCPADLRREPSERRYPPHKIVAAVCKVTNVPRREIFSRSRVRQISRARRIISYMLLMFTRNASLADIGRFFGQNPSTVKYGIELVRHRMKDYGPQIAEAERCCRQ